MSGWLAAGGWVAAAVAAFSLLRCTRRLDERRNAIGDACHEVRGPLAATRLGMALACRGGRLEPSRLRALDHELERAVRAIDDLEQVGGGPAGASHHQAVDVQDVLADSVAAWQAAAASRGRTLVLRRSRPPVVVCGDRVRLAQAVGNLIANALEHGSGPVEVRAWPGAADARIEVRDAGSGLEAPVPELARRRRRPGNRGRGLAITGAIAAAHGGRLSSAPSQAGARIVLTLPLDSARGTARARQA